MKKADIVLIPFPFTDLSGNKKRPALILTHTKEDVTVCFLTTQLLKQSQYDLLIQPSESNGLKKASLIRLNKIATLDKELVIGRIGTLEDHYLDLLNKNLIKMLKLKE
jgi:mRNA interferase MazF